MSFNWLNDFHKGMAKRPDYAEKTLAAYRLGMKAGGSIVGIWIVPGDNRCPLVQALDPAEIYHPDDAPILPLDGCPQGLQCQCVYRPVMAYQVSPEEAAARQADAQARIEAERAAKKRKREE